MNGKANLNIWLSVCALVLLPAGRASVGATITVGHEGPVDFRSIQAAINYANNGDEIMVRPSIYNEAIDFKGKSVRLYSRDGAEVTTIDANGISGAYHVVQCISGEGPDTVLEGFTITGGNANGLVYPDDCGGGMYNYDSDPTVTNCLFTDNSAVYGGGGMYNEYSTPTVTNCVFIYNTTIGVGGGMGNEYSSTVSVTDCNFISNAANRGGGIFNYESTHSVSGCTLSDNTADDGGGMFNERSHPTVTNCTFKGNEADNGGGIFNQSSHPTVNNCMFSSNEASDGGGMLNESSDPTVANCTFSGNTSEYSSGGMYNHNSNPKVTNSKFSNNASRNGGGMLNSTESDPTLTNCTFSGNTASDAGGGMYNRDSQPRVRNCTFTGNTTTIGGGIFNHRSQSTLTNCILWGDTPDEIYDIEISSTVNYCDIQGSWSGAGGNNIDADPCFFNAAGGDLRLSSSASPCVDAGDSTRLLAERVYLDLDLKMRYVDIETIVDTGYGPLEFLDIGAYEFNCNYAAGDNNCDGVVNFKDVAILAGNWLAGIEPEL